MNQWNQRMMFPQTGMPQGLPQNASSQQNFYRPTSPQQFYSHSAGAQFHGNFQPQPAFLQNMNPMSGNFPQNTAPQRPMTPAELESLKKKQKFEDQQKRLMAMKHKGGHPKTSVDVKDLFGKKGRSGGMSSLLGSLGDVGGSKSRIHQGQLAPSNVPGQLPLGYNINTAQNIPTPIVNNPPLSNWSTPTANVSLNTPQGDFEQFQGFSRNQDDFGDFQQSSGFQFPASPSTQQPAVPRSNPSDGLSGTSVDLICQQQVNTDREENKAVPALDAHQTESKVKAPPTPSIEDLMKQSLSLDTQIHGKKFEKPKISKTIKAQPSHFTESAKASKFQDLDSLSEMFTIPQSALAHPVESHVMPNSNDDWSDFSGASDTVFQENNPAVSALDSGRFDWNTQSGNVGGSKGQYSTWKESSGSVGTLLKPANASGNEGQHGTWQSTGSEVGIVFQSGNVAGNESQQSAWNGTGSEFGSFSQHHTGTMWLPQITMGSDVVAPGVHVSHGNPHEGISSSAGFQYETPRSNIMTAAVQNQGVPAPDIMEDALTVDPEQATYGLTLPDWSKNSNLLPAVYKQIYKICSSGDVISTSQLYPILLSSDLPRDKLGHIWSACNKANPGELNEQELYLILGMVALAQVGLQVNKLTLQKLASCVTAPIPSFPESIFQNESDTKTDILPSSSTNVPTQPEQTNPTLPSSDTIENTFHPSPTVDAIKHPDWSKWKNTKANQIDDQFADFQMLKPSSSSTTLPNLNWSGGSIDSSFSGFQSISGSASAESISRPVVSEGLSKFGVHRESNEGSQSFPAVDKDSSNIFGNMASANDQQLSSSEDKTTQSSAHVMSVPLQASQRYTLNGDEEGVDYNEKAWLKCLSSCATVIMKACQTLQSISDPNLMNEIFASQQGISYFSAIIEIYCVSQRVKTSILKSAPNNKKLKANLENIDNIWKTCLTFQPFRKLLPQESFNFSGCHVNDSDDVNMSCGVCLLNVDKSWINWSVNKNQRRKLNYGNRQYHTTCANFWCNKVDSVLPYLQLNVTNSLI